MYVKPVLLVGLAQFSPHSSCNKLQGQFFLLISGFLICLHTWAHALSPLLPPSLPLSLPPSLSVLFLLHVCWLAFLHAGKTLYEEDTDIIPEENNQLRKAP